MIITNTHYQLLLVFLYSAFATWVAVEYSIVKLKKYKYTVPDRHKYGKPEVPSLGGIPIFIGIIISLALIQLLKGEEHIGNLFIFYFIVTIYTMYGVLDDLFHFQRRYDKIIAMLVLSLPIGSLISHDYVSIFGYHLFLDGFLPYLIAPLFIMIVANLINIHSAFNGLSAGLALILFITVGIKSYMLYGLDNLLYLLPVLGATVAFFPFNFFPAKILDGNSGTFLWGSALGAFLVINKLEFFGIIILIPHIISFLLDTWVILIKKVPDIEFPEPRKDGIFKPHPSMRFKSVKNLVSNFGNLTEKQITMICWGITAMFCFVGVVWF